MFPSTAAREREDGKEWTTEQVAETYDVHVFNYRFVFVFFCNRILEIGYLIICRKSYFMTNYPICQV